MTRSRAWPTWALVLWTVVAPMGAYIVLSVVDGGTRGRFPTPLQGLLAAGPATLMPLVAYAVHGRPWRGLLLALPAFLLVAAVPTTLLAIDASAPDHRGDWYGVGDVLVWFLYVPTGLVIESVIGSLDLAVFSRLWLDAPDDHEALNELPAPGRAWPRWLLVGGTFFAPGLLYALMMLLDGGARGPYPLPVAGLLAAAAATLSPLVAYTLSGHYRRGTWATLSACFVLAVLPALALALGHLDPGSNGELGGVADAFIWIFGVPLGLFIEAVCTAVDLSTLLRPLEVPLPAAEPASGIAETAV